MEAILKPFKSQINKVVADPAQEYVQETLREIELGKGIRAKVGRLSGDAGKTVISEFIFDAEKWKEPEANKWLEEHGKAITYFEGGMEIKGIKDEADGKTYIEGYASTFDLDRDMEVIDRAAFDQSLAEYMSNPIVLFNHMPWVEQVAGKVIKAEVDSVGLKVRVQLITPVTEMAKQAIQNIRDGILKTFSIGGIFEKLENVIKRITLLEISIVAIPANPFAMFSLAKAVKSYGGIADKTGTEDNKENKEKGGNQMPDTALEEKVATILEGVNAEVKKLAEKLDASKPVAKTDEEKKADAEAIKNLVAEALKEHADKTTRKDSKITFPISGRAGNLKIEDKQLLDMVQRRSETVTLVDGQKGTFTFKGGLVNGAKGVAMDTAEAGGGSEFVPTELASELIDLIRVQAKVYNSLREWQMPTASYDVPIKTGDATWYLQGEATDDSTAKATSSNVGTGKMTLASKKLGAKVAYSTELDEDSAVAMLPFLRDDLVVSGGECLDNITINGDTTATHQDSDVTGSTDARKAWKGFRKLALAISGLKVDLSTFSADNLLSLGGAMGKYAGDLSDLIWICSPKTMWNKLFTLRDAQNNNVFLTMDKAGANAVNVNGALGIMFASPVIISDQVRDNVNASGVYDGTTTTKSTILLVRRRYFQTGNRRILTFRQDFDGDRDQNLLFVTMRKAFSPVQVPSTSISSLAIGYNF